MWISHCLVNIENEACGLRRTADCVQLDERNERLHVIVADLLRNGF